MEYFFLELNPNPTPLVSLGKMKASIFLRMISHDLHETDRIDIGYLSVEKNYISQRQKSETTSRVINSKFGGESFGFGSEIRKRMELKKEFTAKLTLRDLNSKNAKNVNVRLE